MVDTKIKCVVFAVALVFLGGVADCARADYYAQGILKSTNILSGATVTAISTFHVTATVPANTTLKIKFSQDNTNFYNSSGTKEGWNTCSNGTTDIDLTGLSWTGALLFYKLQLETTDVSATPTVSETQVDYTGTTVPAVSGTTYYGQGILASINVLAGAENVTAINEFDVTASIPAGTTVGVSFSQDGADYYNSSGVEGGWDSCANGANNIDLSTLGWSGDAFFYKIRTESLIDNALMPSVSEVNVDYDGGAAPPPSEDEFYAEGTLVSTDLLNGSGEVFDGRREHFGYYIRSLPYGSYVYAQFSNDNTNWYSSAGTLWDWDTLSSGAHMTPETAIDLDALGWAGETSFYYKLRLTSTLDQTWSPTVSDAGLFWFENTVNSPELPSGQTTVNASQVGSATVNLVGMWSFDGPDVNVQTNVATDRSTGGHNGTMTSATQASGKNGQALDFNGTSSHVNCGDIGSVIKTVSFWMKADDITSRKVMNFDGTKQIEIDGTSHVLATSFPGATVYIDGVAGSVVDSEWHSVIITDSTGVNSSTFDIGRVSSGYFDGKLDEVRLYTRVLTIAEIQSLSVLGTFEIVN